MNRPPRYRLSDAEKDALLEEQAALILRLAARVAELEAALARPKKASSNSHKLFGLSSINHPEIIAQFNKWLGENNVLVAAIKAKYDAEEGF
jgi:hypothetical protein